MLTFQCVTVSWPGELYCRDWDRIAEDSQVPIGNLIMANRGTKRDNTYYFHFQRS